MARRSGPRVGNGKISDRVATYIVGYIRRHRLEPDAGLPSEVRASADLGVSRGIVREAYRSLNRAGILKTANGRQPRVSQVTNRVFTEFLEHALATRQISPDQLMDLRQPIECHAAELAAGRRTDQDVIALRKLVARMRRAALRRNSFVQVDVRFHETLGRATGNLLFGLVASALRQSLEISVRTALTSLASAGQLESIVDVHDRITEAIAARKPAEARRWMTRHFVQARAAMRRDHTIDWPDTPRPQVITASNRH